MTNMRLPLKLCRSKPDFLGLAAGKKTKPSFSSLPAAAAAAALAKQYVRLPKTGIILEMMMAMMP